MADAVAATRAHVGEVVRSLGLGVREAATPQECAQALADRRVAAVVCEPLLWPEDPAGWVASLRRARPDVVLIAHTADARAATVVALKRAGVHGVLAKPAREDRLRELLARALGGEAP